MHGASALGARHVGCGGLPFLAHTQGSRNEVLLDIGCDQYLLILEAQYRPSTKEVTQKWYALSKSNPLTKHQLVSEANG